MLHDPVYYRNSLTKDTLLIPLKHSASHHDERTDSLVNMSRPLLTSAENDTSMLRFTLQVEHFAATRERNHLPSLQASDSGLICPINVAFRNASDVRLSILVSMGHPSEVVVHRNHCELVALQRVFALFVGTLDVAPGAIWVPARLCSHPSSSSG
jgi:hypothetical protein